MKRSYGVVLLIGMFISCEIKADLLGDRSANPIYTRALRVYKPRLIVVKPLARPPQLSQEQRPEERLAQRQMSEEEIKEAQERLAQQRAPNLEAVLPASISDEKLKKLYDREVQKRHEAEIASYTHMYGSSDLYGGLYNR